MFKYLNIALIILIFLVINAPKAQAATEFLTSWRANTFVDAGYAGKVLPVKGSKVVLAFELLDGGKIADISKNEVWWFRNGSKFESGLGRRTATLTLPTLANSESVDIKITVRKYNGVDIDKFITIPIASPEVVIDSRYPLNTISAGLNAFAPLFYFWNTSKASNLKVSWTSGGEDSQELNGNNILQLSIPAGATNTALRLAVTAKNPEREFEVANADINLKIGN